MYKILPFFLRNNHIYLASKFTKLRTQKQIIWLDFRFFLFKFFVVINEQRLVGCILLKETQHVWPRMNIIILERKY